ncbi:3'-5' exoribonuclease [Pseudoxanthomonas mexicana]|nr:3'-5' exoribonuclease [Pseudoxanthomonas mexicana]
MTYLFLDTEWADPTGSELVSLALITEDGIHRFYAERDPLPDVATDFV